MFGAYVGIFALMPHFSWIETGLMLLILWIIDQHFRKKYTL